MNANANPNEQNTADSSANKGTGKSKNWFLVLCDKLKKKITKKSSRTKTTSGARSPLPTAQPAGASDCHQLPDQQSLSVAKQQGQSVAKQQSKMQQHEATKQQPPLPDVHDDHAADDAHDKDILHQRQREERKRRLSIDFLKVGDTLSSFSVMGKITNGGFGQIYRAYDWNARKEVALKVEYITPNVDDTESTVLKKFQGNKHCPVYYGNGETDLFIYMAMQLLGKSLNDCRKSCPLTPSRLSLRTAYRVCCQGLRAIEGLHAVGFLHRDIKPSNFAVGHDRDNVNVVYLLDFGLCRHYVNADGTVKANRGKVGFRGTVRYASINAHGKKDLGRRDDLWSLLYSFCELMTGAVKWRNTHDKNDVLQMKTMYTLDEMGADTSAEVKNFAEMITALSFEDRPNYDAMHSCLETYVTSLKCSFSDPYDWQMESCLSLAHWNPTSPDATMQNTE